MPLDVVQGSPPVSPNEGDVWVNTRNGRRYVWMPNSTGGGAWVHTPPVGAPPPSPIPLDAPVITNPVPKITMSNQPPLAPTAGDLWFDTVRGFLFVFYNDGNTTQWVVANPGRGGNEGPPGPAGVPAGPAGGDLDGNYPDPIVKDSVALTGAPTAPTPTANSNDQTLVTTNYIHDALAALPSLPTALPPNGPAGGDLTGSYPNPTIKSSVTLLGNPTTTTPTAGDNSTKIPTTAFVAAAITTAVGAIPSITLPVGSIAFGGAGGAVTGNSTLTWDNTNKAFGVTGWTGAVPAFAITGTVPASPAVDAFLLSIANPSGNTGNIFRLRAGATGTTDQFKVDMTGDGAFSGSVQAFALNAPPAGGAANFGIFLGNFTGGNTGLFFGTGTPTFSTFGRFGSIYMNQATPGIPWYNNNGTTGWDRLVGETSTQTLSNKTITGYTPTSGLPTSLPPTGPAGGALSGTYPNPGLAVPYPTTLPPSGAAGGDLSGSYPNPTLKPSATNGWVMTTVGGVSTWAAASGGGASISIGDTPPGSPSAGAMWWNSTLGTLFLYYNDGNSSQWVPAAPAASAAQSISANDVLVYSPGVALNAGSATAASTGLIGLAGQKWEIEAVALIGCNQANATIMGVAIYDGTSYLASGGGVNGWQVTNWPLNVMCKAQKILTGPTNFSMVCTGNAAGALVYANGQGGLGPPGTSSYISARRLY